MKTNAIKLSHAAPSGTAALAVRVWGDVYAVAANWAAPEAKVYTLGENGWEPTGSDVSDYDDATDALGDHLAAIAAAGGDELADDEIGRILGSALWAE